MRKIAILNRKGGVAKTTTSAHLAGGLALIGRTVLLIDTDPQAHCSRLLGVQPEYGLADLMDGKNPADCIFRAREHLDLIAGSRDLAGTARLIARRNVRSEMALSEALEPFREYDYVIIDTAPSISELSVNVLFYADEALIPVSMELLAVAGLGSLRDEIENIRRYHELSIKYILPTFIDYRVGKTDVILTNLKKAFQTAIVPGIRYSARISELPQWGKLIWEHDAKNQAAADYARLCGVIDG